MISGTDMKSRMFLFFFLFFLCSCTRLFVNDPANDANWVLRTRDHFLIYARPDSFAARNMDSIVSVLETDFDRIETSLNVDFTRQISIFLYSSREDAGWKDYTSCAFAFEESAAGIYSPDLRSLGIPNNFRTIVHVMAFGTIGVPRLDFLSDGLGIAMDRFYFDSENAAISNLYDWTAYYCRQGKLYPLKTAMTSSGLNPAIGYVMKGSFVEFLLEKYGNSLFKRFYREANLVNSESKISEIYGKTLTDLEADWITFCTNR